MEMYDHLIKACWDHLPLFSSPVLGVMESLLSESNVALKEYATKTFIHFVRDGCRDGGLSSYNIEYFVRSYVDLVRSSQSEMRAIGLRGLSAFISRDEDIDSFIDEYVLPSEGGKKPLLRLLLVTWKKQKAADFRLQMQPYRLMSCQLC